MASRPGPDAPRRARRLRFVVVPAIAVLLVAGAVAAASAALNPAPRVRLPGADAALSSVARVYIDAAEHGDCGTTRALTSPHTGAWCDHPRLLSARFLERSGDDGACMDYEITTTASGGDAMPTGTQPWSFCFVQTTSGWRLWDQGQG